MGKSEEKQAYDVYHCDQSFAYISDESPNNGIIVEVHKSTGWSQWKMQTEKDDKLTFERIISPNLYDNSLSDKWWNFNHDARPFIVAYLHSTKERGANLNMVLYPSITSQEATTPVTIGLMWDKFLKWHGVDCNDHRMKKVLSFCAKPTPEPTPPPTNIFTHQIQDLITNPVQNKCMNSRKRERISAGNVQVIQMPTGVHNKRMQSITSAIELNVLSDHAFQYKYCC